MIELDDMETSSTVEDNSLAYIRRIRTLEDQLSSLNMEFNRVHSQQQALVKENTFLRKQLADIASIVRCIPSENAPSAKPKVLHQHKTGRHPLVVPYEEFAKLARSKLKLDGQQSLSSIFADKFNLSYSTTNSWRVKGKVPEYAITLMSKS